MGHGGHIAFAYDALNRVTSKTYPEGGADAVAYAYDNRSLELSALYSASGQGVTNAYDGFGRLSSSTTTMGDTSRTLAYAWDRDGNRITLTHPDGIAFGCAWDGLDRPTYLATPGVGIAYTGYRPDGPPDATSRGNDELTVYAYDAVQRPSTMTHIFPGAGASANVQWQLARNPAGLRRQWRHDRPPSRSPHCSGGLPPG